LARELGWRQRQPAWYTRGYGLGEESADEVVYLPDRNVLGVGSEDNAARFLRGRGFARHSRIFEPDLARQVDSVAEARRMADWVVFAIHNHEGGAKDDEPSEHIVRLAHAVIDAGADVVVGHGPHNDRGIEIYNGRPIFYALGNFIMQNDVVEWEPWDLFARYGLGPEATPADIYDYRSGNDTRGQVVEPIRWQSAVATVDFCGGKLDQIVLHPVDLGFETHKRSQRGRPVLADGAVADEILNRFRDLSAPFGTRLEVVDGRGVIRA
ncbi:MAG: CapA family protein, partial [Chloroflexi bacterium]|nr:CapA family protein [Chloroflexota bacterium]